jgi:hypothetical protein
MPAKYDRVYFWATTGSEGYAWREAFPGVWPQYFSADDLVSILEAGGRVAVRGHSSIGAPEGAPDADSVKRVMRGATSSPVPVTK